VNATAGTVSSGELGSAWLQEVMVALDLDSEIGPSVGEM
jgi:hypothetical protein